MSVLKEIQKQLRKPSHIALVTSDINRRYVTGFKSSAGVAVITHDEGILLIDSRYYEKASEQVEGFHVILMQDLYKQLERIFEEYGADLVSIENKTMTVSELNSYTEHFSDIEFDSSEWLSDAIGRMRIIKTEEEIEKIIAAQKIAEAAFSKLLSKMTAGMTEKQVATALDFYMMDLGADDLSFDTIAASGKNSACPHAVPTSKPLEDGDFLTLDFGAVVDGYHSDMTRTVCVGKPTDEMKEVYNAVWGANTDALKAVRAGITCKLLDSVARSTLEAWSLEKYFGHGLGHGVGLEIHEAPTVSPRSDTTLHEGMIITIEPGVYLPHKFGVRIEDMCVVTENGCRNLTNTPKSLIYI